MTCYIIILDLGESWMRSPEGLFIVFEKFTKWIFVFIYSEVYWIDHSDGTVYAIEWTYEVVFYHLFANLKRILICYPSCINRIHVYFVRLKLTRTSSSDHVQ